MDVTSYLLGKKAGGGETPTGTIDITQNGTYNVSSYASADVNVQPDLETKSITITENTTTTITPTSGKDGLSSVEVTTNVPQPSGKINITQNGTDIDVSSYALADVSVSGGKYAPRRCVFSNYTGTELNYELENIDSSNMMRFANMFSYCSNLISVDLKNIVASNMNDGNANNFFLNCSSLTTITNMENLINTNILQVGGFFQNCSSLTELNLQGWNTSNVENTVNMFYGCTQLMKIDMRDCEFTNVTDSTSMFGYQSTNYVPSNCLIIVKDATQKQWITSRFSRLTNVKTVAEYEAS